MGNRDRGGAVTISRDVAASPEAVWKVLADGWMYPLWVVGATRMRDVDDHWPEVGAELHHSVGTWPLLLDDSTQVLEVEPGRMIKLKARAWPTGAAEVVVEIEGIGYRAVVRIREDAVEGPGALVPKPLRQLAIAPRNREALRRLAFLAEGR